MASTSANCPNAVQPQIHLMDLPRQDLVGIHQSSEAGRAFAIRLIPVTLPKSSVNLEKVVA